jgi:lipid-binding SYLF domain-containing protein
MAMPIPTSHAIKGLAGSRRQGTTGRIVKLGRTGLCRRDKSTGSARLPRDERMETPMLERRHLLCGLGAVAMAGALAGCSTTEERRLTLDQAAQASLDELYRTVPASRPLAESSAAVLVFPRITNAGLFIGGRLGDGVMFKDGVPVDYYRVTGGSFGFQAGAQTLSQVYFFTTPEALRTFENTAGFEVGAGLGVAVATVGTTGQLNTSTLQSPVIVFVFGQSGLMAGVQVEGQKITRLARN